MVMVVVGIMWSGSRVRRWGWWGCGVGGELAVWTVTWASPGVFDLGEPDAVAEFDLAVPAADAFEVAVAVAGEVAGAVEASGAEGLGMKRSAVRAGWLR